VESVDRPLLGEMEELMAATNRFTGYGYPVLTNTTEGPLPRLRKWIVPGANRHIVLRDGAVGFLLIHLALWWHEVIHPLNAPGELWDEWGYSDRRTDGVVWSEHAGGQAMDLDATRHPRGVALSRNLTPLQIVRIRARLLFYRGVLGWGGQFRRVVDGMHFERKPEVPLDKCERVARRMMDTKRGRRILAANPGAAEVILS
jgi:hypothetical protein